MNKRYKSLKNEENEEKGIYVSGYQHVIDKICLEILYLIYMY